MPEAPLSLALSDQAPSPSFHGILGQSPPMREVVRQIETVATTDATVLVLGETGSGKELIARAVHASSRRATKPFVSLNCAAIPKALVESELFGHEKGAFTGALSRRTGRFELAHEGTLFLDEIGDLDLETQPKLLRVLQEREFERLGSCQTIRSDVRLVAATHRDLPSLCALQTFRSDLFYRLNVFPIYVPPLRERREDIPLLVRALVPQLAQRMKKDLRAVSMASMASLQDHEWPGNVRELQNVLEHAVILAEGPVLEVRDVGRRVVRATSPAPVPLPARSGEHLDTLEEVNRSHILAVLASTKGVIAGPNGAAAKLGIKRTTLHFRMKKLGITTTAPRPHAIHG